MGPHHAVRVERVDEDDLEPHREDLDDAQRAVEGDEPARRGHVPGEAHRHGADEHRHEVDEGPAVGKVASAVAELIGRGVHALAPSATPEGGCNERERQVVDEKGHEPDKQPRHPKASFLVAELASHGITSSCGPEREPARPFGATIAPCRWRHAVERRRRVRVGWWGWRASAGCRRGIASAG